MSYHCVMEKFKQLNNVDDQGSDDIKNGLPKPNLETIEKWLTEDLTRAYNIIGAVLQDKGLRHQMAVWFTGKIENARNKPVSDKVFSPDGVK